MGGLARLQEGGAWKLEVAGLSLVSITALICADDLLIAGGIGGIAQSTDHGQTWQSAAVAEGSASITAFAVSPHFTHDQTIIAATVNSGILRSDDGGQKWLNVNLGLQNFEINALLWSEGEIVLAATADGLYRSSNGGRAWRLIRATEGWVVVALTTLPDGMLVVALEEGGLLCSSDGGTHWKEFGDLPGGISGSSLWTTPQGKLLLSTSEHGLLRSTADGENWETVLAGLVLACTVDGTKLYTGTTLGVSVSTDDGRTWCALSTPPLYDLRQIHLLNDHPLLAGSQTGLLRYERSSWQSIEQIPYPLTRACINHERALFVASPQGLQRSLDGGETWQTVLEGEHGNLSYFTFRADGCGWAGSANGALLLRTRDGGTTWQPLAAPFGVLSLVTLQTTPELVIAATYDPRLLSGQIWISHDEGEHWQRAMEAQPLLSPIISHNDPPLIALGNLILFITARPDQWHQASMEPRNYGQIRRITGNRQILLVLTTRGLYRSFNAGASWTHAEPALPIGDVWDIALAGDTLYVLLAGGCLWSCRV
jgi:photosystem II stability/assembly factor-like uncharacterized protein